MENDMNTLTATVPLMIAYVAITLLKPDPNNPRIHSPRQIRQIARSLRTFGFIVPILVDASYRIVAGHGRYMGAQLLKMADVPIIIIEHLTPDQLKAFQIADNALNENSDWSQIQLGINLKELSLSNFDLIEVTGLDTAVVDLSILKIDQPLSEASDPADEIVEQLGKAAVSKSGDIFEMNKHRLICGDARNVAHFKKLMGKRKASAAFLDPPFNVKVKGHVSGKGRIQHRPRDPGEGLRRPSFLDAAPAGSTGEGCHGKGPRIIGSVFAYALGEIERTGIIHRRVLAKVRC
jgi:ParB-like nuclease domain